MFIVAAAFVAVVGITWTQLREANKELDKLMHARLLLQAEKRKVFAHRKFLKRIISENPTIFLLNPDLRIRKYAQTIRQKQCSCSYCRVGSPLIRDYYDKIVLEYDDQEMDNTP